MDLYELYERLHAAYGPQHWWPGETPFEVMVGAILTQNTAWTNVEKAIARLKFAGALEPERLLAAPVTRVAEWIRPSGYFNVKAERLRNFCRWYVAAGGFEALVAEDTAPLRRRLLSVNGVGPETADDILLYAFERPVFVIDAYTRRILSRLALVAGDEHYERLRAFCEQALAGVPQPVVTFNEYHALIVLHGKDFCRKRPLCSRCVLRAHCPAADRL